MVGGGFAGVAAARGLADAPVDVLVVDRNNFQTFQPFLYQVATAGLQPADVAYPIRGLLRRQPNASFRLGTVTDIVPEDRRVVLDDRERLPYDFLILAAGAVPNDFGIDGVRRHALPLYTMEDAVRLRNHILHRFEEADRRDPPDDGTLTFVVVGGGPTGVEMAGALVEMIQMILARDYRTPNLGRVRVVLLEMLDTVLPPFPEPLRRHTLEALEDRRIEVRLESSVAAVDPGGVELKSGEHIPSRTVIWAAGMRAGPLAPAVTTKQGKQGRVQVEPDLSLPGHENIFVVGDTAESRGPDGSPHPQLAPVAIQHGEHAAEQIRRRLDGRSGKPFRYRNRGIMATIGRRSAVAQLPTGLRLRGTVGWLAWLLLHLIFLVGARNRLSVLVNWAWSYIFWERGPRMIFPRERRPYGELREAERREQRQDAGARPSG